MMRDGRCPKCAAAEVYCGERALYGEGTVNIRVYLPDFVLDDFPLECYVCVSCGYVEFYTRSSGTVYGTTLSDAVAKGKGWRRISAPPPRVGQVAPSTRECPNCGALLRAGQAYCSCGTRIVWEA